jgi:glucose-6-phosphate dehydrogenase assembly protein OpcA
LKLPLDRVEPEIARLWDEEASRSGAPRVELATLVALVSEPSLLARAQAAVSTCVAAHPSRTIVAVWHDERAAGASIEAEVTLHHGGPGGVACGDAIVLEATGGGREWLPENVQRLALADLPICVWWVGDLPDFDRLFDRTVSFADLVVVDSGVMDLRDLEKLSQTVARTREGGYALSDFGWQRLRPFQELVARFFDDREGRSCLQSPERIVFAFAGRSRGDAPPSGGLPEDAASTEAGLFFGWIAHVLKLPVERAAWTRGDGWAEVALGKVVARFERRDRADVPPGAILSLSLQCRDSRFEIERLEDPCVVRWSRDVPGTQVPPQTLRVTLADEPSMLVRCVQRPKRDPLLEASLHAASRIVQSVAPRLSMRPPPP